MTEKKITKRDCIKMLLNMAEVRSNANCVRYLENELALLDNRKNNKGGVKAQAKAAQTAQYKEDIEGFFLENDGKKFTATEIVKTVFKSEITVQKVSAILKALKEENFLVRTMEKKVAYYMLTPLEEDTATMAEEEIETVAE